MISSFVKAFAQVRDSATRRLVWIGCGIAFSAMVVVWLAVGFTLTQTSLFQTLWLDRTVDLLGGLAILLLSWFLFPGVVSAAIGLLGDRIAEAVEARHYPGLPPARGPSPAAAGAVALRFLVVSVALNLVVLVFLVVPPVFPFVFYAVNGYLLSREYFEQAALRRMDAAAARALKRERGGVLFLAGLVIAFLLTVPVLNLLAPVVATAAMVHLVESWRRRHREA